MSDPRWTVDEGPVLVWDDRILPIPVEWSDGVEAYDDLARRVRGAGEVDELRADRDRYARQAQAWRRRYEAAVSLLGEVVDWLGVPDWSGPQLPVDVARRIAAVIEPTGCTCRAYEHAGRHTDADHASDCAWARGAGPTDTACGGCWGCINAQVAHHERLRDGQETGWKEPRWTMDEDVIALIRAVDEGRASISDRGFVHMQPVDLGEDRRVVVYQSSADEPRLWIKVVDDDGVAFAHMTDEQARHLVAQLHFLLGLHAARPDAGDQT